MKEYIMNRVDDFDLQKFHEIFSDKKFEKILMSDTVTCKEPEQETYFCGAYSSSYLYFYYKARDEKIHTDYTEYNQPLYKADVVEVFICVDGNLREYFEYEVSPKNVQFLGKINNNLKGDFELFLQDEFVGESRAMICDGGFEIVLKIPKSYLKIDGGRCENVLFNAFRVDKNTQNDLRFYALNPTGKPNFHLPEYFIKMLF